MSKAGRNRRQNVERQPNGDIRREKPKLPIQRVRAIINREIKDPRYGTWLGLMAINLEITEKQWDAACTYRDARKAVDALLGLPARYVRAIDYERVSGRSNGQETLSENEARAISRFRHADECLGESAIEHRIVVDAVIFDGSVTLPQEKRALSDGLERLAKFYSKYRGV
jgi:hypothetical protein